MRQILSLLAIALLLWCTTFMVIEANQGPTAGVYSPEFLYVTTGTDARGVFFQVSLDTSQSSYNDIDISSVRQILKNETDGDLRILDTMDQLDMGYLRLVHFTNFLDPTADPENGVTTILLKNDENQMIQLDFYPQKLYEYPEEGKRTLLSDLLDTKTTIKAAEKLQRIVDEHGFTEEACNLIKAELEKEYTPAWVLPTAICGGAVVLAAAVAVPTVIIRRKKRKMAADGNTAEAEGV